MTVPQSLLPSTTTKCSPHMSSALSLDSFHVNLFWDMGSSLGPVSCPKRPKCSPREPLSCLPSVLDTITNSLQPGASHFRLLAWRSFRRFKYIFDLRNLGYESFSIRVYMILLNCLEQFHTFSAYYSVTLEWIITVSSCNSDLYIIIKTKHLPLLSPCFIIWLRASCFSCV